MQPIHILAITLLGALHGYTLAASDNWLVAAMLGVAFPTAAIHTAKDMQSRDAARLAGIVLLAQIGQSLLLG